MIHPYHPLCGKEFELIHSSKSWGEDRVHFYDAQGEHCSLPASWTDIGPEDPCVKISQGRSYFCFEDLLTVVQLVQHLQQDLETGASEVSRKLCRECQGDYAEMPQTRHKDICKNAVKKVGYATNHPEILSCLV